MAGRSTATQPQKAARQSGTRVLSARILLVARVLAPLAIAACAILFRQQIVNLIDRLSGLGFVFTFVHLYSTASARAIIGALAFAVFAAIGAATYQFAPRRTRAAIFAGISAILLALFLWYSGRSLKTGLMVGILSGCLVAANAISSERWSALLASRRYGRLLNLLFWICIGIEFLLPRAYLAWIGRDRDRTGEVSPILMRVLPSAALAAAALAVSAPHPMLMRLGQTMFMSPAAEFVFGPDYQVYSGYDVSDLALDPATGDIVLCGQEQRSPKVLRKGADAAADTGIYNAGNEYCEFAGPQALVTADKESNELLVIDPKSLRVRGRLHLDRLPHGEIFLAAFPGLNLVAAASENEEGLGGGPGIRIIDLNRMKVIREIDAEIGNLIADPRRPVIYTNHFARNIGVRAWEIRTGRLLATSSRFGRSDRMAFDAARNELLATVPETGQVWRLDADTLKDKAPIETVFGVRGIAIDPGRDLLLAASFLTNDLDVIDLKTGRSLRRYRLGAWMRTVLIPGNDGIAYVASRYGVYRLNYLR
jgi:hypothetical protein